MPKISLTSQQMKALLERVLARESRGSMHQAPVSGIDPAALQSPTVGQLPPPPGSFNIPVGDTIPPFAPSIQRSGDPYLKGMSEKYIWEDSPIEKFGDRLFRDPRIPWVTNLRSSHMAEEAVPGRQLELDLQIRQPKSAAFGQRYPLTSSARGGEVLRRPYGQDISALSPIEELEMAMEPREVALTRLYKAREGEPLAINMPREEAKAAYLANPDAFTRGYQPPPALRIRTVVAGGPEDMTGDLAKGLAFERLKWYPPLSPTEKGKIALGELAAKESGVSVSKAEALSEADTMAQLWQKIGGRRGTEGKLWEGLRAGSRQASKIKDSRDYFISSGVRWRKDPQGFSKAYPREAKRLAQSWKEYME